MTRDAINEYYFQHPEEYTEKKQNFEKLIGRLLDFDEVIYLLVRSTDFKHFGVKEAQESLDWFEYFKKKMSSNTNTL